MEKGNQFGTWLQERRAQLGLSRKELARQVPCSAVSVQKYEYGERCPTRKVFDRLADVLELRDAEARETLWALARQNTAGAASSQAALHQLRPLPARIYGRDELIERAARQIRATQRQAGGASILLSVTGMAGVGKTTFANALGHALATSFPDVQLFVEMGAHSGRVRNVHQTMREVLPQLGVQGKLPNDEAALKQLYLSQLSGQRALIVFDDARDDDHVAPLLPPPGCAAIITSRQQITFGENIRLACLARKDAIAYLRDYRHLTNAEADSLAALAGDLPIALSVIGSYLKRHRSVQVDDYVQEVRQSGLSGPASRLAPIEKVFSHSYAALSEAQKTAWSALSVMKAPFDQAAALAVIDNDVASRFTPDALVALNLIEFDDETGRFGWHDLLREFAAAKLENHTREVALQRFADHYMSVAVDAGQLYEAGGERSMLGLSLFDAERRHIEQVFDWLVHTTGVATQQRLRFLSSLRRISELRFHPSERLRWMSTERDMAQALNDHESELDALNHIGNCYLALENPTQAIETFSFTLARAQASGLVHQECSALGNLANAYRDTGDIQSAIPCYERQLELASRIGNRSSELNALSGLATCHRARRNLKAAGDFTEQLLARARHFGDRRAECYALSGLAHDQHLLGDEARSLETRQRHLRLAREIGDQRNEANALNGIGHCHRELGHDREAVAAFELQGSIAQRIGYGLGEASALMGLAIVQSSRGEIRAAITALKQALQLSKQSGNQSMVSMVMWELGLIYEKSGDLDSAVSAMGEHVAYIGSVGHADAEQKAARVEELRQRLEHRIVAEPITL